MKNTNAKKMITGNCVFTDKLKGQKVPEGVKIIAVAKWKRNIAPGHSVGFVIETRKSGKVVALPRYFSEVNINETTGKYFEGCSRRDVIAQATRSIRKMINFFGQTPETIIFLERI